MPRIETRRRVEWTPFGETTPAILWVRVLPLWEAVEHLERIDGLGPRDETTPEKRAEIIRVAVQQTVAWDEVLDEDGKPRPCDQQTREDVYAANWPAAVLARNESLPRALIGKEPSTSGAARPLGSADGSKPEPSASTATAASDTTTGTSATTISAAAVAGASGSPA